MMADTGNDSPRCARTIILWIELKGVVWKGAGVWAKSMRNCTVTSCMLSEQHSYCSHTCSRSGLVISTRS